VLTLEEEHLKSGNYIVIQAQLIQEASWGSDNNNKNTMRWIGVILFNGHIWVLIKSSNFEDCKLCAIQHCQLPKPQVLSVLVHVLGWIDKWSSSPLHSYEWSCSR
jgi:hypothetical protein